MGVYSMLADPHIGDSSMLSIHIFYIEVYLFWTNFQFMTCAHHGKVSVVQDQEQCTLQTCYLCSTGIIGPS